MLAHHGARLSEAMVLGVGGGLGAGCILWEFEAHHTRTLVLGFRNQWQYPGRWAAKALERLAIPFELHETGGARAAAQRLDDALAAGRPALASVDRQEIGFWHLPEHLSGHGGYPVVVYATEGDRALYADFLDEAATLLDAPDLRAAGTAFPRGGGMVARARRAGAAGRGAGIRGAA